jgi:hypothetical protein
MFDRFSFSARRSLTRAGALARRAGLTEIDTDALLLALADDSEVSDVLARYGATDLAVRDVIACWWGWRAAPDDELMLAAVGIDVERVRPLLPTGLDETAGWRLARSRLRPLRVSLIGPTGAQVLSGPARRVIEVAVWRGHRRGGHPGETDLLWGMLLDPRSRAHHVLCELRVCFHTLAEHLDAIDLPPRLRAG